MHLEGAGKLDTMCQDVQWDMDRKAIRLGWTALNGFDIAELWMVPTVPLGYLPLMVEGTPVMRTTRVSTLKPLNHKHPRPRQAQASICTPKGPWFSQTTHELVRHSVMMLYQTCWWRLFFFFLTNTHKFLFFLPHSSKTNRMNFYINYFFLHF